MYKSESTAISGEETFAVVVSQASTLFVRAMGGEEALVTTDRRYK